ncbi:MAG: hypothetical protein ACI364_05945 [Coriobacteriales bacterium]
MGGRKTFQVHLEPRIIEDFGCALDEHEHISEQLSFAGEAFAKKRYWSIESLMHIHCTYEEPDGFGYRLEKTGYLDGRSGPRDAAWGRLKLSEIEPVFRKYVAIDLSHDSGDELYMLSRIALYEIALRHDCEINRAIPHSEEYRAEV